MAAVANAEPLKKRASADLFQAQDLQMQLTSRAEPKVIAHTQGTIAYLGELLRSGLISESDLVFLESSLEKGELVNPITEERAETTSSGLIHREGLRQKFAQELDRVELKRWIKEVLVSRNVVRVERGKIKNDSQRLNFEIDFQPVSVGKFNHIHTDIEVELTHPIEVMTTKMTQYQWAKLFGANPSHFADGPDSVLENINGVKIKMQPNHPVESITWYSAIFAANKLSEQHGFRPAYDFSEAVWKVGTDAGSGTLQLASGKIKINAPDGDIYRAEGYRLHTEAEREYLFVLEMAAHESKSEEARGWDDRATSRQVADHIATEIGGKPFFDLVGNVREWSEDWGGSELIEGRNPIRDVPVRYYEDQKMAWGDPYPKSPVAAQRISSYKVSANRRDESIGVRFVRTLR